MTRLSYGRKLFRTGQCYNIVVPTTNETHKVVSHSHTLCQTKSLPENYGVFAWHSHTTMFSGKQKTPRLTTEGVPVKLKNNTSG